MFSSITIASSTTSPIASTIASNVRVLMVKPNAYIRPNAPISETGIVTSGISVARQLRRNRKITMTTSSTASNTVLNTSSIDFSMKIVLSNAMAIFMPRSEEHTSERQSLMRISSAVYCLNKKKQREKEQQ